MVTALASNHMCYNSILKQMILVDANGRSCCVLVTKNEGTKKLKSWSQHLNSLEKLIFPVYLLQTYDVVVVKELPEIFEFELPVFLRGKTDPTRPPVFQVIHRRPPSGEWPHVCPDLQYHAASEVVEEHPASNGSVRELEERLFDRWDPHRRRKGWIDQSLQLDPLAIPGTWAPLVSMWWP